MDEITAEKVLQVMGQVVTVHQEYRRRSKPRPASSWVSGYAVDRWWAAVDRKEPRAGWLVGWRTIQDGYRFLISHEAGYAFEAEEYKRALLVVYWPTMNPVKVPPGGLAYGGEPRPS